MEQRRFSQESVTRLIEEYECKRRINGEPFRMSGSELLRIIKINDFEMILKRLRENEETQKKFHELESKILSILKLNDFLDILLTDIASIFRVPYVWVSVIENSTLANLINHCGDSEVIRQRLNFISESDFNRYVKNSTRPILVNKYLSPFSVFFPANRTYPLRSIAIVPLCIDGKVVGSLNQCDYASTRFDPKADTLFLEQLMRKVSLCLSNVAAHESLAFYANHDQLTGLFNRGSFEVSLREEFARCKRHGSKLSMASINLDGFRQINNRHGHEFGDSVLKYVARNLESLCRREDIVARVAGDEFAIIFPETTAELSESLMTRIQEHLDSNPMPNMGEKLSISFNYGIASTEDREISIPEDLLKRADSRLNVSKGREAGETMPSHPRLLHIRAS